MVEIEGAIIRQSSSSTQSTYSHRNLYTIKESNIEIFNFVVFKSMNGANIIHNNLATEIDVL